jgi:alpha-1,3-rhamnosyl/mannosyltransferase
MGRLVREKQLANLLNATEGVSRPYVEALGPLGKALDYARPFVRAIPGAYEIRQNLHDSRARKAMSSQNWGVYHEPSFIPLQSCVPTVVTVHDLSHIRFPEYHPAERVKFLNKHLGRAIQAARHVITVSEFTKEEVCRFFPYAKEKTTAIPLGVDPIFKPRLVSETSETLGKLLLGYGSYILSVATQEPRKNLSGLIKAYLDLPKEVRQEFPLVLVGGKGWRSAEFLELVDFARNQPGRILLTGRVNRSQLADLMSSCKLFAYPSFYEGFGLPIAEALASGVKVLTSNYGAMREAGEPNACLIDPNNFSGDLLRCLYSDNSGVSVQTNSWLEVALRTKSIYDSVKE